MSLERLQNSIQTQNNIVDKKYKSANTVRRTANAIGGGVLLGVGYLGAKSISKEKSMLKDGLAGASDFVLKHTANALKKVDKKEKFTKISGLLQKAKDAPAKTKALVVFGTFIASRLISLAKQNSYLKGVLNQAQTDEKVIRANQALEDEAVNIAKKQQIINDVLGIDHSYNTFQG